MEYVGGRSYGVGAEEEGASAFFGSHYQSPGGGGIAVDVCVDAGARGLGFYAVGRHTGVNVGTIVETGAEHRGVGLENCRFLGKFGLEETFHTFKRAVEEPAHKAQGHEIAAFYYALVVKARIGQSVFGHGGDGHFHHLRLLVELKFCEGVVGLELGLAQVGFFE